jgi:hypothetical protein
MRPISIQDKVQKIDADRFAPAMRGSILGYLLVAKGAPTPPKWKTRTEGGPVNPFVNAALIAVGVVSACKLSLLAQPHTSQRPPAENSTPKIFP